MVLCFPISNRPFKMKQRKGECRWLCCSCMGGITPKCPIDLRDDVPSLNSQLEMVAVPTGDRVHRRSLCLVALRYLDYSGRYKAHTAQTPLYCTDTI